MSIGEWLRDTPASGWTQERLAEEAGVSVETVRAVEQRRGYDVGFLTAVHLCHAMRCSVASVVDEVGHPNDVYLYQPGVNHRGPLGDLVRAMRTRKKWSRAKFASVSGIPQTTLTYLESGRAVGLSLGRAVAISRAFFRPISMFEYCSDVERPRGSVFLTDSQDNRIWRTV
ncbi:helix-turn-helix domain-containing protein [Limnoglobus roseus]|nr:helix-turn-helix domain-containing protein [Limnoglobus roseus]